MIVTNFAIAPVKGKKPRQLESVQVAATGRKKEILFCKKKGHYKTSTIFDGEEFRIIS